ncbi:hypothetical protein G4B88_025122 [Cannabis sativa]|uniref:SWIM-type domain-containing protein n=1 Tax=Cannabis sativa TaxID=3483 RepID=A0A7J6FDF3_CANSA|nr:hypothetical protein G4B88_025122 [Cannabis sativa]
MGLLKHLLVAKAFAVSVVKRSALLKVAKAVAVSVVKRVSAFFMVMDACNVVFSIAKQKQEIESIVVLQHGGQWDQNGIYINFEGCALLIPNNCNHSHLNIANAITTKLTSKYEEILNDNYISSLSLTVHPPTHTLYEVCDDGERAIVDLTWITCSCNRFQMDQIPCKHAIAVLKANNEDPYQYYSAYYMKEAMVATYGEVVYPIGNKDMWETLDEIKNWKIDPPKGRVRVGRAKKRRFKPGWEKKKTKCQKKTKQMRNFYISHLFLETKVTSANVIVKVANIVVGVAKNVSLHMLAALSFVVGVAKYLLVLYHCSKLS